ncbi:MAG: CopG family transcriptional regulator [Limnochordaceae bacterium]|nr:CopG family transcriptional regulator [Limnochordaceae bacterium]
MTEYRPGYVPGKSQVKLYLPEALARALRVRAAEEGITMSELVERALRRELGLETTKKHPESGDRH